MTVQAGRRLRMRANHTPSHHLSNDSAQKMQAALAPKGFADKLSAALDVLSQ